MAPRRSTRSNKIEKAGSSDDKPILTPANVIAILKEYQTKIQDEIKFIKSTGDGRTKYLHYYLETLNNSEIDFSIMEGLEQSLISDSSHSSSTNNITPSSSKDDNSNTTISTIEATSVDEQPAVLDETPKVNVEPEVVKVKSPTIEQTITNDNDDSIMKDEQQVVEPSSLQDGESTTTQASFSEESITNATTIMEDKSTPTKHSPIICDDSTPATIPKATINQQEDSPLIQSPPKPVATIEQVITTPPLSPPPTTIIATLEKEIPHSSSEPSTIQEEDTPPITTDVPSSNNSIILTISAPESSTIREEQEVIPDEEVGEEESIESEEDEDYQPSKKKAKHTNSTSTIDEPVVDKERLAEDELLSKEKEILKQVKEMQKRGEWLPQTQQKIGKEPKINTTHWDFLLMEMQYIHNENVQEKKWKMKTALKNAKSVAKYHEQLIQLELKKKKEAEANLRKQASKIAKIVKTEFWDKIRKLVTFKNQSIIDETKQQLLAEKRDLLVQQTERFTQLISQDLIVQPQQNSNNTTPTTNETTNGSNSTDSNNNNMDTTTLDDKNSTTTSIESLIVNNSVAESNEIEEDFDSEDESDLSDDHIIDSDDEDEDYEDEIAMLQKDMEMDTDQLLAQHYNKPPQDEMEESHQQEQSDAVSTTTTTTNSTSNDNVMTDETLITTSTNSNGTSNVDNQNDSKFIQVAENAKQYQPTGCTLQSTNVKTPIPYLLERNLVLREYQQIGLDWLVTMHDKGLNGILADEMGLGKTIMTISLIAHLASKEEIWGPHLVVVPSSVLLNWEIEFKRWCPSLKILSYHGTQKQRKDKRNGWSKPNAFHVCITSYNLVIQDALSFKRRKWHYLILDEAHHIRNFKGQAWQTLLNFNTEKRLLLTGTPLQNNVMELWSLMHFLMPQIFQSHSEFKDWFSNSIQGMVEGKQELNRELISRLHTILRPFILRRLKKEVSEQLPSKQEHVIKVRLSQRQRNLYEDFISRSDTRETLASGNVFKMINVVMQLRKVCNHPDLFEPRPIISPFAVQPLELLSIPLDFINIDDIYYGTNEYMNDNSNRLKSKQFTLKNYFNFIFTQYEMKMSHYHYYQIKNLQIESNTTTNKELLTLENLTMDEEEYLCKLYPDLNVAKHSDNPYFKKRALEMALERYNEHSNRLAYMKLVNQNRYERKPVYGYNLIKKIESLYLKDNLRKYHEHSNTSIHHMETSDSLLEMCKTYQDVAQDYDFELNNFVCFIHPVRACEEPQIRELSTIRYKREEINENSRQLVSTTLDLIRKPFIRMQMHFPDKRLLQFDCGKLQKLSNLLKDLKRDGHRILIFTQMSKMLDVLESFMSMNGHSYFRLDGQTKLEERQYMMEKFNTDPKIFAFILSTRSGGVGINLTGADTVIFYDSDWNPAMDAQAQDRCHRIGQTRNVNIYRLISESTIEERILLKANQKRHMNEIVIHNGAFTPDFLKNQMEVRDLFQDSVDFSSALKSAEEQMSNYNANRSMNNNSGGNDDDGSKENYNEKDLDRILASVEDESDVEALKNAKREQNEQSQNDYAEENEEDDIIKHLSSVEKYGFELLTSMTLRAVQQEIQEIKQNEKEKTENWKTEIETIQQPNEEPETNEESDENISDDDEDEQSEGNEESDDDLKQQEFKQDRNVLNSLQISIPTAILRDLYGDLEELFMSKKKNSIKDNDFELQPSILLPFNNNIMSGNDLLNNNIPSTTTNETINDDSSVLDYSEIGSGSIDDIMMFADYPIIGNNSDSTDSTPTPSSTATSSSNEKKKRKRKESENSNLLTTNESNVNNINSSIPPTTTTSLETKLLSEQPKKRTSKLLEKSPLKPSSSLKTSASTSNNITSTSQVSTTRRKNNRSSSNPEDTFTWTLEEEQLLLKLVERYLHFNNSNNSSNNLSLYESTFEEIRDGVNWQNITDMLDEILSPICPNRSAQSCARKVELLLIDIQSNNSTTDRTKDRTFDELVREIKEFRLKKMYNCVTGNSIGATGASTSSNSNIGGTILLPPPSSGSSLSNQNLNAMKRKSTKTQNSITSLVSSLCMIHKKKKKSSTTKSDSFVVISASQSKKLQPPKLLISSTNVESQLILNNINAANSNSSNFELYKQSLTKDYYNEFEKVDTNTLDNTNVNNDTEIVENEDEVSIALSPYSPPAIQRYDYVDELELNLLKKSNSRLNVPTLTKDQHSTNQQQPNNMKPTSPQHQRRRNASNIASNRQSSNSSVSGIATSSTNMNPNNVGVANSTTASLITPNNIAVNNLQVLQNTSNSMMGLLTQPSFISTNPTSGNVMSNNNLNMTTSSNTNANQVNAATQPATGAFLQNRNHLLSTGVNANLVGNVGTMNTNTLISSTGVNPALLTGYNIQNMAIPNANFYATAAYSQRGGSIVPSINPTTNPHVNSYIQHAFYRANMNPQATQPMFYTNLTTANTTTNNNNLSTTNMATQPANRSTSSNSFAPSFFNTQNNQNK